MAISATPSNHAKMKFMDYGQVGPTAFDMNDETMHILLMRSGFVFNKDDHAKRINIKGTTGASTMTVNAALKFYKAAGGLIAAGFVPGNSITSTGFNNAGNNTTKIISTVTDTLITVTDTTGMSDDGAGTGNELIVADDELATGGGYTQDTKHLANTTVTEDDTNDRAEMTCDTVTWTAGGGSIGPTPGALIYSNASDDDTIIGYLDFDGEQTATVGNDFTITGIKIRIA